MKEQISDNLNNPNELEKLYRNNKSLFKTEFNKLYPTLEDKPVAQFWNERLNFDTPSISWGKSGELVFVIVASLLAGFLAKLPDFIGINEEFYYSRNIAFIILPILIVYFSWKKKLNLRKIGLALGLLVVAFIFINALPNPKSSDTLILSCIHLPLFLWSILGFTFTGNNLRDSENRIDFLRYNGDAVVMSTLILIAGIILTGLTMLLFSLIDVDIYEFYFEYVVIFGIAATPIVATYVTQTNPQLVNKVSPVIAKIFSPLVLITLVFYLIAIIYTGKDPFNDRDFLIAFNFLLIGVMAIVVFSIAETSKETKRNASLVILFLLSLVTIVINGIALSAIVFRISEWGITPNRIAVLGGNILILANLLLVSFLLFKTSFRNGSVAEVNGAIAKYLPIYSIWTIIVTFLFPFIFMFK
ncbi:MAG: DUF4153 domain-containing protein [Bacteroidia bacterium]|nr:DUF4153 domain-containing protein [Bacteroidia bacterium]NNC85850.1 DUF4153 domain-containing protein [Bacteroidia bacterium]